MKIKAKFTGADLTEGKVYDVIHEYATVYELQCDTGTYCRNKNFFEVVEESVKEEVPSKDRIIDTSYEKETGIPYARMAEIATLAIQGLIEDDEAEASEYLRETIELTEKEYRFFELTTG